MAFANTGIKNAALNRHERKAYESLAIVLTDPEVWEGVPASHRTSKFRAKSWRICSMVDCGIDFYAGKAHRSPDIRKYLLIDSEPVCMQSAPGGSLL